MTAAFVVDGLRYDYETRTDVYRRSMFELVTETCECHRGSVSSIGICNTGMRWAPGVPVLRFGGGS